MNKFAEIRVIQFLNGKTVETFETDDDIRTGRYTEELAGKVRIRWDQDSSVVWVKSDKLTKLDKSTFIYAEPVETDIQPDRNNTEEAIEAALKAGEAAMQAELDELANTRVLDEEAAEASARAIAETEPKARKSTRK